MCKYFRELLLMFYISYCKCRRKQFLNLWLLMTPPHSSIREFEVRIHRVLTGECVHKCRTPTVWDLNPSQWISGKLFVWFLFVCLFVCLFVFISWILAESSTTPSLSIHELEILNVRYLKRSHETCPFLLLRVSIFQKKLHIAQVAPLGGDFPHFLWSYDGKCPMNCPVIALSLGSWNCLLLNSASCDKNLDHMDLAII